MGGKPQSAEAEAASQGEAYKHYDSNRQVDIVVYNMERLREIASTCSANYQDTTKPG